MRYEYTFGGQCRINADDKAVHRILKQYRLNTEQKAIHPEQQNLPAAHTVYEPSLVGCGFAEKWFLDATKCTRIQAPQIAYPMAPIDVELFTKATQGKVHQAPASAPAGLGIRVKVYPDRRVLLGTVDDDFIKKWQEKKPELFVKRVYNQAGLGS